MQAHATLSFNCDGRTTECEAPTVAPIVSFNETDYVQTGDLRAITIWYLFIKYGTHSRGQIYSFVVLKYLL